MTKYHAAATPGQQPAAAGAIDGTDRRAQREQQQAQQRLAQAEQERQRQQQEEAEQHRHERHQLLVELLQARKALLAEQEQEQQQQRQARLQALQEQLELLQQEQDPHLQASFAALCAEHGVEMAQHSMAGAGAEDGWGGHSASLALAGASGAEQYGLQVGQVLLCRCYVPTLVSAAGRPKVGCAGSLCSGPMQI